MNSHYILLCLGPLTYCDLQALANNTHIQVQCIPFDTKCFILCTTVLAQDSRGQFAWLNMLRNVVQLSPVLIRPGISKRHSEHQSLNVKQKGYSKSHFLHSRELQCVKRTVVTKTNFLFLYGTTYYNSYSSSWLVKTERKRKIETKTVHAWMQTSMTVCQEAGMVFVLFKQASE